MLLRTYIPGPPLNKYVELFAYYTGYNPTYSFERLLPEGNVEILIALDEIQRCFYRESQQKDAITCQKAWVLGMQQNYIHAKADKNSSLFAIKFKAGGSYPFLHVPLSKLNNLLIDAELILGNKVLLLREQLLHTNQPDEMFLLAENFLRRCFNDTNYYQNIVDFTVSEIKTKLHSATLNMIAQELGYSQKHFIQLFKKYIGLRPKQYQKIIRFNNALKQIKGQHNDWLQISYNCGFYDQAHFNNEFKFFTGFTPKHYLSYRGEFINFIPLREDA